MSNEHKMSEGMDSTSISIAGGAEEAPQQQAPQGPPPPQATPAKWIGRINYYIDDQGRRVDHIVPDESAPDMPAHQDRFFGFTTIGLQMGDGNVQPHSFRFPIPATNLKEAYAMFEIAAADRAPMEVQKIQAQMTRQALAAGAGDGAGILGPDGSRIG